MELPQMAVRDQDDYIIGWFVQDCSSFSSEETLGPEQTKIVACPRTDINDLKSQGLGRWQRKSRWKAVNRNQVKGLKQLCCLENQKQEQCKSSVRRLDGHQCGPREMPAQVLRCGPANGGWREVETRVPWCSGQGSGSLACWLAALSSWIPR